MKILVAHDSEMLRSRIRLILSDVSHAEITKDVSTMGQINDEIRSSKPDVVVMHLSRMHEIAVRSTTLLRKDNPDLIIIALTDTTTPHYREIWRNTGADFVFDEATELGLLADGLSAIASDTVADGPLAPGNIHPPLNSSTPGVVQ